MRRLNRLRRCELQELNPVGGRQLETRQLRRAPARPHAPTTQGLEVVVDGQKAYEVLAQALARHLNPPGPGVDTLHGRRGAPARTLPPTTRAPPPPRPRRTRLRPLQQGRSRAARRSRQPGLRTHQPAGHHEPALRGVDRSARQRAAHPSHPHPRSQRRELPPARVAAATPAQHDNPDRTQHVAGELDTCRVAGYSYPWRRALRPPPAALFNRRSHQVGALRREDHSSAAPPRLSGRSLPRVRAATEGDGGE